MKPYIFSVLPAGTVPLPPSDPASSFNQTTSVEIRSSLSLLVSQSVPFPFNVSQPQTNITHGTTTGPVASVPNAHIRLMTATAGAKSPLYVMTTPMDKTSAANEGSSLWKFDIKPWTEQIDELVLKKMYSDALALLDVLDDEQVADKVDRFLTVDGCQRSHILDSRFNDGLVSERSTPCHSSELPNLTKLSTPLSTLTSIRQKSSPYILNLFLDVLPCHLIPG